MGLQVADRLAGVWLHCRNVESPVPRFKHSWPCRVVEDAIYKSCTRRQQNEEKINVQQRMYWARVVVSPRPGAHGHEMLSVIMGRRQPFHPQCLALVASSGFRRSTGQSSCHIYFCLSRMVSSSHHTTQITTTTPSPCLCAYENVYSACARRCAYRMVSISTLLFPPCA